MKRRILCLILALVMIVPVCMMSSCNSTGTATTETGGISTDKGEETTKTLTMFLITERHVYSAAEVEAIKAEKGENSKEYAEARGVKESYETVANELNKITKSKFRTRLVIYFYTEEEYKAVEEIMELQANAKVMRKEAQTKLKAYIKEKKAFGITDTLVIQSMFYAEFPEYAKYTEAVTVDESIVTEAETIINEYGIKELKYPDAETNQVDIVCVSGYDKYIEYIEKGWLAELDEELDGSSKAIMSYVNEKIMTSAQVSNKTYGIPTNAAIGNYKYLLVNRELFDFYQYNINSVVSVSDSYVMGFLEDIAASGTDVVPFTGELTPSNIYYWGLDYEYTAVENLKSLDSKIMYYRKNADGTYARIVKAVEDGVKYYLVKAVVANITGFATGVTYYTKDENGYYNVAESYVADTKYYTIDTSKASAMYKDAPSGLKSFEATEVYFIKNSDGTYSEVPTFKPGQTYYVVNSVGYKKNEFSVLGNTTAKSATLGTLVSVSTIFSKSDYKNQLVTIQKIKDMGYYNADAIKDPTKKFAMAMVTGGADLIDKYADDYYMVVLEYPHAYTEKLCNNLFAVSASSISTSRSMEIITYITTNPDFRNLLQYGVKDLNYSLTNTEIDGKTYPVVKRLNNYYDMDINKTGNLFISYAEEGMIPNIWYYGKLQNADAKYDPLMNFYINEYVNKIDFSVLDYVATLSAAYKEKLDACKTSEEIEALFEAAVTELKADATIQRELSPGSAEAAASTYNQYGIYHNYYQWFVDMGYADE